MSFGSKISAGILLYRKHEDHLDVYLVHPAGPYWAKKDKGAWSIPKGGIHPDEDPLKAGIREFEEEVGLSLDPSKEYLFLGEIKQKGGKIVHAWAIEGDIAPGFKIKGGSHDMEWPPRSGKMVTFPEIDRGQFFTIPQAKEKLIESQHPFLDRLIEELNASYPHHGRASS